MKTKDEFSKEVWERVKTVLELRKISQVQLRNLCRQNNFSISQPEISKLYTGKASQKENIPGFDFEALMKELDLEEYIRVDENMIRRIYKRIDRRTLVHILAVLKRYSEGRYLVNLSEKDDSQAYEMVCGLGHEATG